MMRLVTILTFGTTVLMSCAAPGLPARSAGEGETAESGGAGPTARAVSPTDVRVVLAIWRDEEDGGSLHLTDSRTGADLPGHEPIFLGGNYWHAVSPDGRTLAVVSLPQGGLPAGGVLRIIDLETSTQFETDVRLDLWPTKVVFSPDGSRLAVGASGQDNYVLVLFDLTARTIIAETSPDFDPLDMVFTADGKALMVYGARYPGSAGINPLPIAARLDASDLQVVWEVELTRVKDGQYVGEDMSGQAVHDASIWWHPALVFMPGSQKMVLVHADEEFLTTVDFDRGITRTDPIHRGTSWLERLVALGSSPAYAKELNGATKEAALSADGKRLYVVGRRVRTSFDSNGTASIEETGLGLKVIDLATAEVLATADTEATEIALAPDGRHLLLGGWSKTAWTDVLDGDSLEAVAAMPFVDLANLVWVDGAPLIVASGAPQGDAPHVVMVETTSWEVVREWTTTGFAQVWHASLP